jgi:hypothetical protein
VLPVGTNTVPTAKKIFFPRAKPTHAAFFTKPSARVHHTHQRVKLIPLAIYISEYISPYKRVQNIYCRIYHLHNKDCMTVRAW